MKRISFAALALGVWVIPLPQTSRQPSAGVSKKESRTSAQHAEDAREKQQAAETAALNSVLAAITKNEQERAAERQQEAAVESENIRLQRWIIGVGIAQAIALIGTLLAVWYQAKKTAEATKATSASVVAIQQQADAVKRQADIMDKQFALTQPRVHIDGVRVIEFETGHQPIFFVRITNSGSVAAEKVSISIKVEFPSGTSEYRQDQVMTIPAHDARECFLISGLGPNAETMNGFNSGEIPLRVSGHVIWDEKTIEYCYKYNPWPFDGQRPKDLPLFVTCDFDPRRAVGVTVAITGNAMMMASGRVDVSTSSPTDEQPGEPKEPT